MITVSKSTPVGSLGLEPGDHLVRVHVGKETISFEVEEESPGIESGTRASRRNPTGFLKRWGGTARKIEDPADVRLTHINEKHLH
jgi:hypothetical protein